MRDGYGLVDSFFWSIETDVNLWGSLPNHENRNYDGTPPQGLSEARRAGVFFGLFVYDPPRGDPSGAAAIRPVSESDRATGAHRIVGARPVEHGCGSHFWQGKRKRTDLGGQRACPLDCLPPLGERGGHPRTFDACSKNSEEISPEPDNA